MTSRHGYLDVDDDGRLICHECERSYLHLATHIRLAHGLSAAEYREVHGLGVTTPLVAPVTSGRMSERARQPERLAHLDRVRDLDALQASRGVYSWRPEVVRQSIERGEATRREVPADLAARMPPWTDLQAWTRAAHDLVAAGYSVPAIARATDRLTPTVEQRLRRHPRA